MKNFKKPVIFIFLFCFCFVLKAQEAVVSGGGYYEAAGGSISWTLGEPVIETFEAEGITLTQGFQQSALIITSVEEHPELVFFISVFPNPAKEYLNIKIGAEDFDGIWYELYDLKGMKLEQKRIDSNIAHVSLRELNPSVYFLRIIQNNKVLKTFKVIKN